MINKSLPNTRGFQDEMDEDDETQQSSVENYTGVAIKVRIIAMVFRPVDPVRR